MRKFIILLISVLHFVGAFGQEDSLIYINEYVYDLNFGVSQFHRFCPSQKTYNTKGKLLRETIYNSAIDDKNKYAIDDIIYYFYEDDNLVAEEHYKKDASLKFLKLFKYDNSSGNILLKTIGKINNGKFVSDSSLKYKYKGNQLVNITEINHLKKKISKTAISYESDKEIRTKVLTKHHPMFDSITTIKETIKNPGKIIEYKEIEFIGKTPNIENKKFTYRYNEQNKPIEIKYFENQVLISKTTFLYYESGLKKSITDYNSDDKKTGFKTFDIKFTKRIFGGLEPAYKNLKIK